MPKSVFEPHIMKNPLLPFFFHTDELPKITVYPNWHDNIELLHCLDGSGTVKCNTDEYIFQKDDVCIINSNTLHTINSDGHLLYHCLIIDKDFCASNGIPSTELHFQELIRDKCISDEFDHVYHTFKNQKQYDNMCKTAAIRHSVLGLLLSICSKYIKEKSVLHDERASSTEHIKTVLKYIHRNFTSPLTLDEIADHTNISKYHLSREFKRLTDYTIFEYINILRCKEAKQMISGGMSVSAAAISCGFENLSYFSRTYKKHIGMLPSESGRNGNYHS